MTQPISAETFLQGELQGAISSNATSGISVKFNRVLLTGTVQEEGLTIDSSAKFLVFDAGTDQEELMYFPNPWTKSGDISISGSGVIRGLAFSGSAYTTPVAANQFSHNNSTVRDKTIHYPLAVIQDIMDGTIHTGGTNLKIGAATAADISITAHNDQTVPPKIYFDDSNESQIKGNRGDDEGAAGDFSIGQLILTTTERDNLTSPLNGMMIYNATTGVMNFREGGAWVANAAGGTVVNGSDTVAGKWEGSTVAEQGTQSATGGTGAGLVIQPKNLVKTSSGAGDENKIAILDSSGQLAGGFMSSSLQEAETFFDNTDMTGAEAETLSDGSDASALHYHSSKLASSTTQITIDNSTTETTLLTYSLPANTLSTSNIIHGILHFNDLTQIGMGIDNGDTVTFRFKYGSTTMTSQVITNSTGSQTTLEGRVEFWLLADGATSAQDVVMLCDFHEHTYTSSAITVNGSQEHALGQERGTATEDSTGALNILVTAQYNSATVTNELSVTSSFIEIIR